MNGVLRVKYIQIVTIVVVDLTFLFIVFFYDRIISLGNRKDD